MDYIHKLPFLLGGFMAVIVGIASYMTGAVTEAIYIRMALVMVAFYIVGSYIKNTIKNIKEELKQKEEQKNLEALQEEERLKEELEMVSHRRQSADHKVDLVADDYDDEFAPMTVSRIIASKIKE